MFGGKKHKWKIRLGYLLIIFGLINLYHHYRNETTSCAGGKSLVCKSAQDSLKKASVALVIGVLILIYGYIRRGKSQSKKAFGFLET